MPSSDADHHKDHAIDHRRSLAMLICRGKPASLAIRESRRESKESRVPRRVFLST